MVYPPPPSPNHAGSFEGNGLDVGSPSDMHTHWDFAKFLSCPPLETRAVGCRKPAEHRASCALHPALSKLERHAEQRCCGRFLSDAHLGRVSVLRTIAAVLPTL